MLRLIIMKPRGKFHIISKSISMKIILQTGILLCVNSLIHILHTPKKIYILLHMKIDNTAVQTLCPDNKNQLS